MGFNNYSVMDSLVTRDKEEINKKDSELLINKYGYSLQEIYQKGIPNELKESFSYAVDILKSENPVINADTYNKAIKLLTNIIIK